jgi:hypothetical protein
MTTYNVQINLDKLGYTEQEFFDFIKDSEYDIVHPPFTTGPRDLIAGWYKVDSIKNWRQSDGPYEPGVYALVWDTANVVKHPILNNSTFYFGESVRPAYYRIEQHRGALNGTKTNLRQKYDDHLPSINRWAGADITQNLDKVYIWFRPHSATLADEPYITDREYSVYIESQAHAMYKFFWDRFPIGNTRDLPSDATLMECKTYLRNRIAEQEAKKQQQINSAQDTTDLNTDTQTD